MTDLRAFMAHHQLSVRDVGKILSVDPSTVRKYLAPPGASMHRKLNPTARILISYLDQKGIPAKSPVAQKLIKMDNEQFDHHLTGVTDAAAGAALGVDRTTIYRWRNDLEVPATVSKLVHLISLFGWPE